MANAAQVTASTPQVGEVVASKYRVERVVGRGGMGMVLAARHLVTGKRVALKWILDEASDEQRERFEREARAAGRIHHPNVVDVYDVLEHGGSPCLVMELLTGESLAALLARERVLSPSVAAGIAIGIARGLDAAHREGVIHRDLKPANVFLTEGTSPAGVRILDFGISKILDAGDGAITRSGAMLGTPHYMAPEQVLGLGNDDPLVDVYALGAVLYELLSGKPPHHHEKVTALLVEIATKPTTPLAERAPGLPDGLAALVMRALAKHPSDRPASIAALARALEPYAPGVTFDASAPGPVAEGDQAAAASAGAESAARRAAGPISEATTMLAVRRDEVRTPAPHDAADPTAASEAPRSDATTTGPGRTAALRWALLGAALLGAIAIGAVASRGVPSGEPAAPAAPESEPPAAPPTTSSPATVTTSETSETSDTSDSSDTSDTSETAAPARAEPAAPRSEPRRGARPAAGAEAPPETVPEATVVAPPIAEPAPPTEPPPPATRPTEITPRDRPSAGRIGLDDF